MIEDDENKFFIPEDYYTLQELEFYVKYLKDKMENKING